MLAEVEAEPLDRHPVALEQILEARRVARDRAAGSRLRLGGGEALLEVPGELADPLRNLRAATCASTRSSTRR